MELIIKEDIIDTLRNLGISSGDVVLVYSDNLCLKEADNLTINMQLEALYNSLMDILGAEGTLCVPAFFYEYARLGTPFDIKLSPVSDGLGMFSKYIASLPNSKRSPMPVTSVAAVGKNAEYICEISNRHGYGEDSAWDRMYKLNTKIISLGFLGGLTFTNYIEHMAGMPYLYSKIFRTPVYNNGEKIYDYTFSSVRYVDLDVEWDLDEEKFKKAALIENGISKVEYYNNNPVSITPMQPLFDYIKELYLQNPYFFLKHEPNYKPGQIPDDGIPNKK